jgi:hypothetical protein
LLDGKPVSRVDAVYRLLIARARKIEPSGGLHQARAAI